MSIQAVAAVGPRKIEMPLSARLLQQSAAGQGTNGPGSFLDLLAAGVEQVNSMQINANGAVHELLTGGEIEQAEVMTAVQKADMAFRMLVQVRNKLMQAYEEINAIRI